MGTVIQSTPRRHDDRHPTMGSHPTRCTLRSVSRPASPRALPASSRHRRLRCPAARCRHGGRIRNVLTHIPPSWPFSTVPQGWPSCIVWCSAIHLVCTEVGACGIRLVCLLLTLTGLDRFVGASYGTQQQVNRQVEEAIVRYRQEESARLAQDMPAKDITLAKDETFTGGLCLVAIEPKSNYIVLEQAAQGRDQDTWNALMEQALAGLQLSGHSIHQR